MSLSDEIVCPYCEYKFSYSHDYGLEDENHHTLDCEECEKEFTVWAVFSVDYRTMKKEEP